MRTLETPEIWYITGSQHLYGEKTINEVALHSQKIVEELNGSQRLPFKLVFKPEPGETLFHMGQEVTVHVNMDKAMLFDVDTENVIK